MTLFPIRSLPRRALVLALLGLSFAPLAARAEDAAAAVAEVPVMTVRAVRPESRDWAQTVPAGGWLKPWQEAVIASEVGGLRITEINVDAGSTVKRGDVLARLSQDTTLAALHKQQAAVATAKANLEQASANARRARDVRGTGALSDQQASEYLITEKTATATLAAEEAALETEELALKNTEIRAVDDGLITSRSALLGSVVSQGTELFRMIRQARVEWQAEVSALALREIRPGQVAVINAPDKRQVTGRVRMISPTVNTDTGRAIVYVELPGAVDPPTGLYADGVIEMARSTALTVPETAIVYRDGLTYVFTVDDAKRVHRIRVETGRRRDGQIEITTGLEADAQVVQSGGAFLSDNALVTLEGSAP